MKKIEQFDNFKKVNEGKITNEDLMDFVHKLGYESIDDLRKEKDKLAKLEALFSEVSMEDGTKAKTIEEEQLKKAKAALEEDDATQGSDAGSDTGSDDGSDTGSDDGSDAGSDTGSDDGSDTGSDDNADDTNETPDVDDTADISKPKSMHIKSFAEFCGEVEEENDTDNTPAVDAAMNESEIKSDEEFEEYAMARLKKKHPDNFDENIAKKTIDDLKNKYQGNYGAMVGALR